MTQDAHATAAPAGRVEARGEQIAHRREFEWLARAGLLARGAVYGIIGVLAIKLALGDGGKATNQQGALKTIAGQPFGKLLLIVLAVGLFGYALWRLTRAAIGHGVESGEDDAKERISGVASGLSYAALCVTAIKILAGSGGGSSGHPDKAAGGVLDWPAGPWLVGLAGLVLIGVGLDQARRGITRSFC
jgi:H+/Cl- antiporter ClcA